MKNVNMSLLSLPNVVIGNLSLRKKRDPRYRLSGMTDESNSGMARARAFTLIELLVVVLIIGILAAIALPQYRVAVGRARVTQLIIRIDALYKGAQSYYLANGTWPADVRDLDIEIDAAGAEYGKTSISASDHTGIFYNGDATGIRCAVLPNLNPPSLWCTDEEYAIHIDLDTDKRWCRNRTHTAVGNQVCRSMASANEPVVTGYYNDYPLN